jgi:anti-sigma factor RsiW
MRCSELDSLVVSFVDGEIPEDERARVEGHLRACPPCRDRVEVERAAHDAVCAARERLRDHAPPALRTRCAALSAARHGARRWIPVTVAAAASFLAAVIWFGGTSGGTPVLAAQLALDHIKCSKFNSARVSGTPAQLATYWREEYGWPIRVPAGFDGLRLSGVRRCGSSDGATAHVMYTHDGRPLSLFITNDGGRAPRVVEAFGQEAVVWSTRDRTYVLVGNEPRQEMETLAALIRKDIPIP